MHRISIFYAAICALLWVSLAAAQVSTGTITGTVSDATGAVVPGAAVTVRNVDTGITRVLTTNERGRYSAPQLPPGSYEISASIAGFQTEVRRGITLTIGREAVVNFALQVGSVAETVEVIGEAPMLETTSSTVSGLVDSRQMRDIPLNARSFIELVPLQAGAVFVDNISSTSATMGFGNKLSVAGGRLASNSFLLDGAVMNNASGGAGSAATSLAGVETVREFRVVQNAYDAEYGRHTGGVISAVTKSGTNEIHGSVFEFLRNDNLDAARWEDNAFGGGIQPEFRRNQFGFALGGPIRRDRVFFFGSYEGLRQAQGETEPFSVPSIAVRERGVIPNRPACAQGCAIAPEIKPYLLAYPLPTGPDRVDGTADFVQAVTRTIDQNYWTARVDYSFSDSDFLFGRFTYDQVERVSPALTTRQVASSPNRYTTLEHTHIFSPVLLGKTHFSFSRTSNNTFDYVLENFSYPNDFWSFDGGDVPGRISVTGLNSWGGGSTDPKRHTQNLFQFKQDFYRTTARHSLKFGGRFERLQYNPRSDFHSGGTFSFVGVEEFIRGQVNNASFIMPGSNNVRGWRQIVTGLYFHDDIKIRPSLTLNLGVRYEFFTSPREVNNKVANIRDLTPPHIYTVSPSTTDVGHPYFLNPSLKNFEPRVGFAWDPFGQAKTSVRGGFGIFDELLLPNSYITSGVRGAPFYSYADLFRRDLIIDFPRAYSTQVAALGQKLAGVRPEFRVFQYNPDRSYVMKWSLDLEQEVAAGITVSAGYSGSKGVHILRADQYTNYTPSIVRQDGRRLLLIDEPMPNPNFNRMYRFVTDGSPKYHGLRLTLQKRFSRGLQFQTSYTFSKATDDNSTALAAGEYGGGLNSNGDFYGGIKWRGVSANNVPHSFFTNFVYELPGRSLSGAAGKLLGGWGLAGIVRFNSGPPQNISAQTPRKGTKTLQFVGGPSIDLIPGGNNNPVRPQNPTQYFDPAQFSYPEFCFTCNPSYVVHGNLGRNTMRGPGIANVDFTLMKDTALGERASVEFRAEFYNLFNRVNFGNPSVSVFDRLGRLSPTVGRITSTRISARQIQFGLRLAF